MIDILTRIFGRESLSSKDIARERLRLVLVHDRASMSPDFIIGLKEELIRVIREYLDIDEDSLQVELENDEKSIALVASIPVRGFKRAANS